MPPAPDVMARLYADYLQRGKPLGLSFRDFLIVVGFINVAEERRGMDDGLRIRVEPTRGGPMRIEIPAKPVIGPLRVKVLLVDFSDRPGTLPASHYEAMLFSKGTFPRGSMRDFFHEVTLGKVDVTGSVHGWIRLPQPYSYYTNKKSGTGPYPRNAQGMAEDAVKAALAAGIVFEPELDALGEQTITALFIVHAGTGAEAQQEEEARLGNIWSHKWVVPNPVTVADNLQASLYLTVPHDAKVGVCAHELGHLAFQWEDFYDPNYDEDGSKWDGSGRWDLMAGGSWNGSGACPAHPAGLHKMQHGWIEVQEVRASTKIELAPYTNTSGKVVKIISSQYRPGQYLLVENRRRFGFDAELPGEGLLVWRVDEKQQMFKPDRPALLLLQADGRHDLESAVDWNSGDAGDPFPGSAGRVELGDDGDLSTTFPGGNSSGIKLHGIKLDPSTGNATFEVTFAGTAPLGGGIRVFEKSLAPGLEIPDAKPAGVTSELVLDGASGIAREIAVSVEIEHAYIADLRVELIAPSGLVAVLHDRTGGNADNIKTVYRSTEVPSLARLVGEPAAGTWRLRVSDHAAADAGVLLRWGVAIAVDEDKPAIAERRAPALTIPDNDPAGIADALAIARAGIVKTLSVGLDIAHPNVQDLRVELVAPSGARALLHDRSSGDAGGLERTFSSADTPALAALVGSEVRGAWTLRVADQASRDTGTLNAWTLAIELSSATQARIKEASPNLAIPDNTPVGVGSALGFDGTGTVQAIELKAAIEHSYIGDLRVELVAPSGASAVVHDRAGGRTQNLNLDLSSAANATLATLIGQPAAGNWVLRVADLEAADTGLLKTWSLRLTYA